LARSSARAWHDVVVLARGRRLLDIKSLGLVVENVGTGVRETVSVRAIEKLEPDDPYDLVVVPVRSDHLAEVLFPLAQSRQTPTILFFGNNARGSEMLTQVLGRERVVLGFPGAGGELVDGSVRFLMIPQQPTTLGELDGTTTKRTKAIASVFERAGFPTVICSDMESWLKTHAAFVTSVAAAVYVARGDAAGVASDSSLLKLMVESIGDGFRALRSRGVRAVPWNLRLLNELMPEWFAVRYWRKAFGGPLGRFSFAAHANRARDEMEPLAADVWRLVHAGVASPPTPSLDRLFRQAGLACVTS
jgi:2-dehydropantoate 2-reductase